MMTKLIELYMHGLKLSFIEAPLNSYIAINIKIFNEMHKLNNTYMHK